MPSAFLLGGTGQIGLAVAARLAREGWDVRLASRRPPPMAGSWRHVAVDRTDDRGLAQALGAGADLLLDCVAFDATHADQLLALQGSVGRIAVVSSASVYRDEEGRSFDEAAEVGYPRFPVPIPEDQPTVAPGPQTYSTRKVAMERRLLDAAAVPVTVLRPAAIHGPRSKHAREWWFVKRLLDRRARIPLAYGGRSRFQTTSAAAIGEAVLHAVRGDDVPPVLNVADADTPTVAEIGWVVMDAMRAEAELVGLPDEAYPPEGGGTPWSAARPVELASSVPASGTYAETAPPAVAWLVEATRGRDWRDLLPQLAAYRYDHFDYLADDRALKRKGAEAIAR